MSVMVFESVLGCLNPGDRGGLQMLPAADFVTVHKIGGELYSTVIVGAIIDRALIKSCGTNLSNPHDDGEFLSLPSTV